MSSWTHPEWRLCRLEPLDVVAVSDARGLEDGGWAREAPLSPLQVAGALRTQVLVQAGYRFGNLPPSRQSNVAQAAAAAIGMPGTEGVRTFCCTGPLRTVAIHQGQRHVLLFPAPLVACVDNKDGSRPVAVARPSLQSRALTDLTAAQNGRLHPVGLEDEQKAMDPDLRWRDLISLRSILESFAGELKKDQAQGRVVEGGDLEQVERRHGHERAASGVPDDGKLFSRSCLRMMDSTGRGVLKPVSIALLVRGVDQWLEPDSEHIVRLGGDGHLARLLVEEVELPQAAELAEITLENLAKLRGLVLYLASPAVFDLGWRPRLPEGIELAAAAVGRPRIVSGWDLAARRPRPVMRAAPPGCVYFLAARSEEAARTFINTHHLRDSISDRYGELGFGTCLVGPWDARTWLEAPGNEPTGGHSCQKESSSCFIA